MKSIFHFCPGESHKSTNKPCQDCAYAEDSEQLSMAIVSDGHGGERYFRSQIGSKIAVDVTKEAIKFFVERTVLGDAYNVVVNHKPSELIKKPVQQEMFADEYERIWANCLDDICENVKDEKIREKFRLIHFESFTKADGLLMLQIPDVAYHQWLESDKVLKFFYSFLSKHFGKDIKLNYRLPKKKEE